jgi:hypothetical protein
MYYIFVIDFFYERPFVMFCQDDYRGVRTFHEGEFIDYEMAGWLWAKLTELQNTKKFRIREFLTDSRHEYRIEEL